MSKVSVTAAVKLDNLNTRKPPLYARAAKFAGVKYEVLDAETTTTNEPAAVRPAKLPVATLELAAMVAAVLPR